MFKTSSSLPAHSSRLLRPPWRAALSSSISTAPLSLVLAPTVPSTPLRWSLRKASDITRAKLTPQEDQKKQKKNKQKFSTCFLFCKLLHCTGLLEFTSFSLWSKFSTSVSRSFSSMNWKAVLLLMLTMMGFGRRLVSSIFSILITFPKNMTENTLGITFTETPPKFCRYCRKMAFTCMHVLNVVIHIGFAWSDPSCHPELMVSLQAQSRQQMYPSCLCFVLLCFYFDFATHSGEQTEGKDRKGGWWLKSDLEKDQLDLEGWSRTFTFTLLKREENSCFDVSDYIYNTVLLLFSISVTVADKLLRLGYISFGCYSVISWGWKEGFN